MEKLPISLKMESDVGTSATKTVLFDENIIENGKVFTLDKDGEKKSEATGLSLPYAGWKIQYQR